ncbi:MAG: DUF6600 domain-containing protein [Candidatus Saccharibacteria bacterium]
MKPLKITTYLAFILLLSSSCAVQQKQSGYSQDQEIGFQVFYDELSPYGHWVDYSNYGYIWIPDVRREFAPYSTDGHWVMTDYGWTWVSDYRWGWAPFHYGRWDYDDYYGWFWVPDNEWGPAWVTWRAGNGYYGWAPMRPGMNINNSFNNPYPDINRWNFVRDRDFGRNDIDRYYINRGNYTTIINNSTVINNTTTDRRRNATYVAGPPEDNVQRATGRTINRVRIQDNERPGQKLSSNELKIYRPQVEKTADRRTTPPKVTDIREIKPVRERGTGNSRKDITPMGNSGEQRRTDQTPQRERRRIERPAGDQQPTQKSVQIPQPRTTSPDMAPGQRQDQNERRRTEQIERQRTGQEQMQNRQMEQNKPGVSQQPITQPPVTEQKEIQERQQVKQDMTKEEQLQKQQQLQIQRQQQQIERQQQQLERQQQIQRRRQERQQTREQQQVEKSQRIPTTVPAQQENQQEPNERTPSGSRRR